MENQKRHGERKFRQKHSSYNLLPVAGTGSGGIEREEQFAVKSSDGISGAISGSRRFSGSQPENRRRTPRNSPRALHDQDSHRSGSRGAEVSEGSSSDEHDSLEQSLPPGFQQTMVGPGQQSGDEGNGSGDNSDSGTLLKGKNDYYLGIILTYLKNYFGTSDEEVENTIASINDVDLLQLCQCFNYNAAAFLRTVVAYTNGQGVVDPNEDDLTRREKKRAYESILDCNYSGAGVISTLPSGSQYYMSTGKMRSNLQSLTHEHHLNTILKYLKNCYAVDPEEESELPITSLYDYDGKDDAERLADLRQLIQCFYLDSFAMLRKLHDEAGDTDDAAESFRANSPTPDLISETAIAINTGGKMNVLSITNTNFNAQGAVQQSRRSLLQQGDSQLSPQSPNQLRNKLDSQARNFDAMGERGIESRMSAASPPPPSFRPPSSTGSAIVEQGLDHLRNSTYLQQQGLPPRPGTPTDLNQKQIPVAYNPEMIQKLVLSNGTFLYKYSRLTFFSAPRNWKLRFFYLQEYNYRPPRRVVQRLLRLLERKYRYGDMSVETLPSLLGDSAASASLSSSSLESMNMYYKARYNTKVTDQLLLRRYYRMCRLASGLPLSAAPKDSGADDDMTNPALRQQLQNAIKTGVNAPYICYTYNTLEKDRHGSPRRAPYRKCLLKLLAVMPEGYEREIRAREMQGIDDTLCCGSGTADRGACCSLMCCGGDGDEQGCCGGGLQGPSSASPGRGPGGFGARRAKNADDECCADCTCDCSCTPVTNFFKQFRTNGAKRMLKGFDNSIARPCSCCDDAVGSITAEGGALASKVPCSSLCFSLAFVNSTTLHLSVPATPAASVNAWGWSVGTRVPRIFPCFWDGSVGHMNVGLQPDLECINNHKLWLEGLFTADAKNKELDRI